VPGPVASMPTYPGMPAAPAPAASVSAPAVAAPVPSSATVNPVFRPPPAISGAPVIHPTVGAPAPAVAPALVPSGPTIPQPSALPPADEFGRTPASGGATVAPGVDYNAPDVGTNLPYNTDPSQGPVGMAPVFPTMALASSMSGRPAYAPAVASMKVLGLSDATIQAALQNHMAGAA
jgi:hypothetical protein